MECDISDAMASIPQFRNWLEDWEGENNEMSRGMWEEMEDKADKAIIAEVEGEIQGTDCWRGDRDSKNDGREGERRERFNWD